METYQSGSPDYFSGLNKEALKQIAKGWATKYPVIEEVTLFRAASDREQIEKDEEGFEYALVVQYRGDNPTELKRFQDWLGYGFERCSHVIEELADAIVDNDLRKGFGDKWMWFTEPYEEVKRWREATKQEFCSEFLNPYSAEVLWEGGSKEKSEEKPKRQSTQDKKAVRKWVKSLGQNPPGVRELAREARKKPEWKMFTHTTLERWIRPVHPAYTPRKPGRKPKEKNK